MKNQLNYKHIALTDVELKSDEAGTFTGYASIFNGNDLVGDTILPGAFKDALACGLPKMFFNHESWELPIGKWLEVAEDEKGLKVKGELTSGNPQAEAVKAAMKHGTVDGLSIGFRLHSDGFSYKENDEGRLIFKIAALPEISVVTFPCDTAARVETIKSEDMEGIQTVRDLETFLRDSGGFSKTAATALIAKVKHALVAEQRDSEESNRKAQEQEICNRIKKLAEQI